MSDYIIHTETYVHKSGKSYIVEVSADDHFGRPDEEYPDGHGIVVDLDFDPEDEGSVDGYIEDYYDEDEQLEQKARYALMRPLGRGGYRYAGQTRYYDVWESRKKALKDWGVAPENVDEVVEKDFKYLDGWYCDDWHWACVSVYALDEDGEKSADYAHHCGGYESSVIDRDQRTWFEEVIEDGIAQVEHEVRKALHKDQLELSLCA